MAAAAPALPAPQPSIFHVIVQGDLAEVQRRVEADPSAMEERGPAGQTPLMWAIFQEQPAIALWLIQHRGDHDLEAKGAVNWSAMHCACCNRSLEVVQQLVAAGADAAATTNIRMTPLMLAASGGHADIAAFLLTLPAVHDSIDSISKGNWTALSLASYEGRTAIVQLLLDAGANPTIPQGDNSPHNLATADNRHDIVALLTRAIAEPQRPRLLHKARSIVDASFAIRKAQETTATTTTITTTTVVTTTTTSSSSGSGEMNATTATTSTTTTSGTVPTPVERRRKAIAAAPEYLRKRLRREEALPRVVVHADDGDEDDDEEEAEKRQAVLAYTLGMAYGEKGEGMPREIFTELLEMMVPRWDHGARQP